MFCSNCGAELTTGLNFCPYCGQAQAAPAPSASSLSLMNKAFSAANEEDEFNLILISTGTCDKTVAGDILEDIFGYTDAESANLIKMMPVVVGQNMTVSEATTVAQVLSEYGIQVSVTNKDDQYVDLSKNAVSSVFDSNGSLLAGAAAVIGALTVANRITSYRRYRKPSLLERIFHINYQPAPPRYVRRFRPRLDPKPVEPRHTIRKPAPAPRRSSHRSSGSHGRGDHGGRGGRGGRR